MKLARALLLVCGASASLACGTDLFEGTTMLPNTSGTGGTAGGSTDVEETSAPTGGSATGGTEVAGSTAGESTGAPGVCGETFLIKRTPAEAQLTGGWMLGESTMGEGVVVRIDPDQDPQGAVVWDLTIPCTATWHVWVRYWDDAQYDSYFVQLDQQPDPAPIFEGDCTANGDNWGWRQLNWRDPNGDSGCEYVMDPWTADWDAGDHQISFEYRQSRSLGRIIVTNDDAFVPGDGD